MITENTESVKLFWTTDGKRDTLHVERDALRAERETLHAERDAAAEATPAKPSLFAVCDCGAHEAGLVDEDGLCVDCGSDVVIVVDRHSADLVAQLRQGRGVDERLDAATRRAEEAEAKLAAAQAEGAARFDEVIDLLKKNGAFDRAGVEALIAAIEAAAARRGSQP